MNKGYEDSLLRHLRGTSYFVYSYRDDILQKELMGVLTGESRSPPAPAQKLAGPGMQNPP